MVGLAAAAGQLEGGEEGGLGKIFEHTFFRSHIVRYVAPSTQELVRPRSEHGKPVNGSKRVLSGSVGVAWGKSEARDSMGLPSAVTRAGAGRAPRGVRRV